MNPFNIFNKKKCSVCGYRILIATNKKYTITKSREAFMPFQGAKQFDAIDCPKCGCQNILAERVPADLKAEE